MDSNIDFEFHVSPELPVTRKNGFVKLATLCGFNLCEEKTQSKRNIKEELSFFNYTIKAKNWKFDEFWYKYENDIPMLASKVREVCTSPASSVGPESSFSVANFIHRKERSNLSSRNLRYSMLLKEKN
ncbi:MAG: hAT family dimerization domain-containing protein [Rickettsiales bacterium]|nr:hAT family dimerization domain-containing protein [Rickettsiales bacterium]